MRAQPCERERARSRTTRAGRRPVHHALGATRIVRVARRCIEKLGRT